MSRIQDPQKAFFPLGNPFKKILPKGSSLSPKLVTLLNGFEGNLAERLKKLKPVHKDDIFSFSWMVLALTVLSETHNDIKSMITELELPVSDWDDKWIDIYLDNSVKLMDICIGFSSELSRLSQGQLLLNHVLQNLKKEGADEILKFKSSIDSWRQHIAARNVRIENCVPIIDKLMESLELPKVKNSAKGKVLMRAMYGVKMETLFVCSVFVSAFTGSDKKLIDLQVSGIPLWGEAFNDLQTSVYGEIRNLVSSGRYVLLKDLEAVDISLKEPESEAFQKSSEELEKRVANLSIGLDLLTKEVDGFFQIVLGGRDALLCNLRVSSSKIGSPKKVKGEPLLGDDKEDHVIPGAYFQLKAGPVMADQNRASKGSSLTEMDANSNMMGKIGSGRKMNGMENGMNGMSGMNGMKVSPGMAFGITPIPIPGTDGGFQFQLGPIGFGVNWGLGFIPGPLMSYSQPIVVSPYMPPSYVMPSPYMPPSSGGTPPYANVQPYQQQPGGVQPLPQGHMPYPVQGNAHGSSMSYIPYPSQQYASGTNQMSSPSPEHK